MEYNFRDIEKKWQEKWKADGTYKVTNGGDKPKCYVLDMFPYPSGAGLHVGHPLGYIASDIYARYKRLKGFNVLHPMGFDSFGLPAEQYALETGQHPATTTEKNIATFKKQLDRIGFCYDWEREVRTSDPAYYKWTQWIFLKLYNAYFCNTQQKARPISELIAKYETKGCNHFTAEEWKAFSEKEKSDWLMKRRLAFVAYGEVNWCEALGTVLANDEVVNGVSERGGHPVEKKKMRQWYLRITAYADRLLQGLETVDFSDAMKEMQRNWIGKSEGAEIEFGLTPGPSPGGEGSETRHFKTANADTWKFTKEMARENRKEQTKAEEILWGKIRNNQLGYKVRRQHTIGNFIIDFAVLEKFLLIEVDGGYHNDAEQKLYDDARTTYLQELGYTVLRFTNEEVENETETVVEKINDFIRQNGTAPLSGWRGAGGEAKKLKVYTTRPDTIFGVDFMVIAPEHEMVAEITSAAQKEEIEKYLAYVKSRSERERLAEVKQVTGAFTGAYAINPFNGREIPIYIAEYVLAGYGTGAIMAVPCGDQRDYLFAKHFNIPITNIIGDFYNGEEPNPTKDAVLQNSGFMDGMKMSDAIGAAINKIEEMGIGKRKKNYKMRDAGFSRQRYWGEPFPIIWENEIPHDLPETDLPLELPHVDKYGPGPDGEGPLANISEWIDLTPTLEEERDLTPNPSPEERGVEAQKSGAGFVHSSSEQWKNTIAFAKQNRKEPTKAEDILWQHLRNRQVEEAKFRRQYPMYGYIPDFVCLEKRLIIEVDGGYHTVEEQKEFDKAREAYLKEFGFNFLRFTNDEVENDKERVLQVISEKLRALPSISGDSELNSPLPWRGAGGEVKLRRESSTMPGYAGSSWYFLRYMDPHNANTFCDRSASDYWNQVDVYIGGTEHAVGHLLYSRMWTKVLYDLGLIGYDEPYKKLVNQGMIQGSSRFVYRVTIRANVGQLFENANSSQRMNSGKPIFVSVGIFEKLKSSKDYQSAFIVENLSKFGIKEYEKLCDIELLLSMIHVDVNLVDGYELDIESFKNWKPEFSESVFILENGDFCNPMSIGQKFSRDRMVDKNELEIFDAQFTKSQDSPFLTHGEVEKMSKSKYNTVNPDDLCDKYGADTFRMYEMFLGPVEQSKPWDTKGIEGVHRFLRKLWRLFFDEIKGAIWTTASAPSPLERAGGEASDAEWKAIYKTIKKIDGDTENFSYNTSVSAFMVCVNELTDFKCHKKEVLEKLLIILAPYAPHISEELWQHLGNAGSVLDAPFPKVEEKYLVESSKEYPVSINGKMRTTLTLPLDITVPDMEATVLANEVVQKWMEGKPHKKIIFVKGKMINVVV